MITLNRERGFETIESWDEILELPGFCGNLDPSKNELDQVIGSYLFKDRIPCGLSTCHQPHGKGYIASTKSGLVTNVGNICGKNHFGVEFDQLSRIYTRAITEHNNRQSISSFVLQIEDYLNQITELRGGDRGADWINRQIGCLMHRGRGCPDHLIEILSRMTRTRTSVIEVSREATKDEISQIAAQQGKDEEDLPKPQYITDPVGDLSGLSALYPENNLRDLVVINLQERIRELEEVDVDSASYDDLRMWAMWCADFDRAFEKAVSVVESGRRLLQFDNLSQLLSVLEKSDDKVQFKKFISNL